MNNLSGKRLLLMGGGAFAKDIQKYAKEQGIYLIAIGDIPDTLLKKIADEKYDIDTQDVEKVADLVVDKRVDGIFVGASEENIRSAIQVAEKTGCFFYATQGQWDILSNKKFFKGLLREYELPLIQEYNEKEDPHKINYPVIVKPIDGSGAKGITICRKAEELEKAIAYAKSFSECKEVLIEQFIEEMDDVFIRYHLQNGRYSISSSFDKHSDFSVGGFTGMPVLYTHPTKHLQAYIDNFDPKIQGMLHGVGLKNGVITLQGFVDKNENFFFYEAGYRLGGSQTYLFTDALNQSNSLYYMINLALTGEMADYNISQRDDPWLPKMCCNQYVPLRAGTITTLDGVEQLQEIPGIINITQFCHKGDKIEQTGDLRQVCLRMHLVGEGAESLDAILREVDDKLIILDEYGNDMRMCHIRSLKDLGRDNYWV